MIREGENACRGSALIYILVAIALLAALTATFMGSSSQNPSAEKTLDLVTKLNAQIQTYRSAIQECVLTYPNGDKTMPAAPATVGGAQVTRPYPLNPRNSYLLNPVSSGAKDIAANISCPGNPGNSNDHAQIFGAGSGKFSPPKLNTFWNWYYNGSDGVFIQFGTTANDAYIKTALDKINEQFAPCEVEVVDARTGPSVTITSDNAVCQSGNICLMIWLVTKPTALFPTEPGCPLP